VLSGLQVKPSLFFEMQAGSQTYHINLTYDLFSQKGEAVYVHIRHLIEEMSAKYGSSAMPLAVAITHRAGALPGLKEEITKVPKAQIIELEPGSSALGILQFQERFNLQTSDQGVTFLTSRPWKAVTAQQAPPAPEISQQRKRPTHILYRNLAYPISVKPLVIGRGDDNDVSIRIQDQVTGVSRRHCTIQLKGDDILLIDHSSYGTFVDGVNVSATTVLRLGQTIRLGTPGEELHLIACVNPDET
jgi:hypothetical protein